MTLDVLILANALFGCFFAVHALLTLNQMTRHSCWPMRIVNISLLVGGVCMVATPFYGVQFAELDHFLINLSLAGLLVYGRRETDRGLPG